MARFSTLSGTALRHRIGLPQAPVVIVPHAPHVVAAAPCPVPPARPVSHAQIATLAPSLQGRSVVVICHKGLKLPPGAAALLRTHRIRAAVLDDSAVGWAPAHLPGISVHHLPRSSPAALRGTRHRPKIGRIDRHPVIRRLTQPEARFLSLLPAQTHAEAERCEATDLVVQNVPAPHGGPFCTFDARIKGFGLRRDTLGDLARVLRAADTDDHAPAPEAARLLAPCLDRSRGFSNQLEQRRARMILCNAFRRRARRAQPARHDWSEAA